MKDKFKIFPLIVNGEKNMYFRFVGKILSNQRIEIFNNRSRLFNFFFRDYWISALNGLIFPLS